MEKLAIIELSEAGLKLAIMEVRNGKFRLVKEDVDKYPLFDEIRAEKLLKPKTISDLVLALKRYKKVIDSESIEKVLALASPFLHKARNQKGFLDEVYNNTNLTFSYIEDEDYIKGVYNSVINHIDCSKGISIDVGVNTITLIKYNRRTTLGVSIIPFGVYSTLYTEKGVKRDYKSMIKFVLEGLNESNFEVPVEEELTFVGLGTPFINLGRIAKKVERYPLGIDNNYQVSNQTFEKVEKFLLELDIEKVRKVKGIVDANADELMAGLAIIRAFYTYFNMKGVTISTANFRDGLVRTSIVTEPLDRYSDMLSNSFDSYREFMPFDTDVNLRVNNMVCALFKQLKVMHKLPRAYIKALRTAAYMFNSGKQISYQDYERHGFYVILNSNLCGISQKDLLLAAFACLCQNPDNFNLSDWMRYQSILTEEDMDAVRKIGILIKLSALLNSSKDGVVTDIICDMLGDSVIMKTVSATDAGYDVVQGMKVADEYRKLFKKNLQII